MNDMLSSRLAWLGAIQAALGAVATSDPALIGELIGPRWAGALFLVTGVLTVFLRALGSSPSAVIGAAAKQPAVEQIVVATSKVADAVPSPKVISAAVANAGRMP